MLYLHDGIMGKDQNNTYGVCKIDSKNRITLNPRILDFLNVEAGDRVSIEKYDERLVIHKAYIAVLRNSRNNGGD